MDRTTGTIFIVDDDVAVLRALGRLVASSGYEARTFVSPESFLEHHDPSVAGCIVLDLSMPGRSGLQLQEALAAIGDDRPVIFVSGFGDIPQTVRAMRAGAVDFLTKPVDDEEFLAAVDRALDHDRALRLARAQRTAVEQRMATLTMREREVLEHVVSGRLNKQIAGDLGTAEKTIKVHRARMMAKMRVRNVPDLVRLAGLAGVLPRTDSVLH